MIFWDLILKTENPCGELERMYSSMSLQALAKHLGVAKDTLRKKLVECKIPLRPRGGSYPRIPREDLPDGIYNMGVEQIAALTGYSENYCRKLRVQIRRDHDRRKREREEGKEEREGREREAKESGLGKQKQKP